MKAHVRPRASHLLQAEQHPEYQKRRRKVERPTRVLAEIEAVPADGGEGLARAREVEHAGESAKDRRNEEAHDVTSQGNACSFTSPKKPAGEGLRVTGGFEFVRPPNEPHAEIFAHRVEIDSPVPGNEAAFGDFLCQDPYR
jgi:hypothetical protein